MGLKVEDLSVRLGDRAVLEDVTVRFAPGRVTAVLGANGAGKSTLLRTLAALVPAARGRVLLDDQDVATMPARDRARAVGYLPQDGVVHWNMTVRDLVGLGRLPHGDAGVEPVEAALEATDTRALADRSVRTLSGGERARVLLARVLAGEPRWLLADEPLASLDPLHQLETLSLLRSAAQRGPGVVAVLHDLTHAAWVADEVVLLRAGRVLAAGPTASVLTERNIAAAYGIEVEIMPLADRLVIVPVARLNI